VTSTLGIEMVAHTLSYSNPEELLVRLTRIAKAADQAR
jgi:hypothetical protein